MAFFKCKMRKGAYPFVVVEADNLDDRYNYAQCLPIFFGDATLQPKDTDPEEIQNPLAEAWPIFTKHISTGGAMRNELWDPHCGLYLNE